MKVNGKNTGSNETARLSAKLRIIGVVVLVMGITSASIVYWMGTHSPDIMEDPMTTGYTKAESRQIQVLIGKMGLLMVDFTDSLKRPGTQAFVIFAVSTFVAIGCFYFAGLIDNDVKED